MIHAIVGATGNTGRRVVGAFARRGLDVRAIVRSEDGSRRAGELGIADTAIADLHDVDALSRALDGAGALHVVPPLFHPNEDELVGNAVSAAERAGVERFVLHSVLHPHTPTLRHHMQWTILQPAMYAQTVLVYHRGVASEDGHAYATYELAGPEVLTMAQLAEQLGASPRCCWAALRPRSPKPWRATCFRPPWPYQPCGARPRISRHRWPAQEESPWRAAATAS